MMCNLQIPYSGGSVQGAFELVLYGLNRKGSFDNFSTTFLGPSPGEEKDQTKPSPLRTIIESWESVKSLCLKPDTAVVVSIALCDVESRGGIAGKE